MGEIKFTEQQQSVIRTSDKNILVSAAAGSGKTTVLVERIIRKITRKDNPVRIDKILVLTFTNAAAAQMREKIEEAIEKQIKENPDDENLARQAVLVHNAQITTIHSFCMFLLKNHFEEAGIDPSFRPASEGEIKLVEGKVVEALVDELFETGAVSNFELLADRFAGKNSLAGLKQVILSAYKECRNAPFVDEYLEDRRKDYRVEGDRLDDNEWVQSYLEDARNIIGEAQRITEGNLNGCRAEGGAYGYIKNLEEDWTFFDEAAGCRTYDEFRDYFANNEMGRLSGKKMPETDPEVIAKAKDLRNVVKDDLNKKLKTMFAISSDTIIERMKGNEIIENALVDVLYLYDKRLREEKDRRKIIDFSDMEHLALSILVKRENRKSIPSKMALEYADFYDEIMVDEYQDSNMIQEEILESISGKVNSRFNRFMVGDVKQSIYRFRNACPDIFMEKYDSYPVKKPDYDDKKPDYDDKNAVCERIDLSQNYRSRVEVVDGVNYVFERIMGKDFGKIAYDEASRLYVGATYPETDSDNTTELLIMDTNDAKADEAMEMEATMVAGRIRELVGTHQVKDSDTELMRPCSYGDIVILLRATAKWGETFKRVLESYGIPSFCTESKGYFETGEIRELMNLLKVLDNPLQDIPLFGVMAGYFGSFTDDEIGIIRTCNESGRFLYDTVVNIARGTVDENELITGGIVEKCVKFTGFIDKWRNKRAYTLIHVLLSEIIEETGYLYNIGSLPMGDRRMANVSMLIEKAKQYETGSFKGLYHFIRYINEIKNYNVDFGEASLIDEREDVVKLMTIHKSKGLEFPICFVCGTGKQYNNSDIRNPISFESHLGAGFNYVDTEKNVSYKEIRHEFIKRKIQLENAAEEMRVLYVAMTRAKEKLILTGTCKDPQKELEAAGERLPGSSSVLLPYGTRSGANSYLKLLINAVGAHDNSVINVILYSATEVESGELQDALTKEKKKAALLEAIGNHTVTDVMETVKDKITYVYPHENIADLYTKTSVSELKIAAIEEKLINHELEGISDEFFTEHESKAYVPDFVEKKTEVKGTARGTAYHRVMELLDFAGNVSFGTLSLAEQKSVVDDNFERIIGDGLIDKEDASLVSREKVRLFLASDLGRRMCVAASQGKLYIEEPFVLEIDASRLNRAFPEEEKVLIQGIIDVFFEEEGKLVLMDYKTDRVDSAEELVERYGVQLDYYKEALERIREKTVAEKLIYSFSLEKTIEVK